MKLSKMLNADLEPKQDHIVHGNRRQQSDESLLKQIAEGAIIQSETRLVYPSIFGLSYILSAFYTTNVVSNEIRVFRVPVKLTLQGSWKMTLVFGLIIYNRVIVYIQHYFLKKVIIHVSIIDQWSQTARLTDYPNVHVMKPPTCCQPTELFLKPGLRLVLGHLQTVQTQIRRHKTWRLIRVCTVGLITGSWGSMKQC